MKLFLKIVGGVVTFIVFVAVILCLPIWDDATINDSDVALPVSVKVADSTNAAVQLPQQSELSATEQGILKLDVGYTVNSLTVNGRAVANDSVTKFVSDSTALVTKFEKAAMLPTYQCPDSFGTYIPPETTTCSLSLLRSLAFLTNFHAQYYLQTGQVDRAVSLITAELHLGQTLTKIDPAPSLIEYLVGIALTKNALDAIDSNSMLKTRLTTILPTYIISDESNGLVIRSEYMTSKLALEKGLATRFTWYELTPNKTINTLAAITRTNILQTTTPCDKPLTLDSNEAKIIEYKRSPLEHPLESNLLGRSLISIFAASMLQTRTTRCEINKRLTDK
jgi:hypothetical protein